MNYIDTRVWLISQFSLHYNSTKYLTLSWEWEVISLLISLTLRQGHVMFGTGEKSTKNKSVFCNLSNSWNMKPKYKIELTLRSLQLLISWKLLLVIGQFVENLTGPKRDWRMKLQQLHKIIHLMVFVIQSGCQGSGHVRTHFSRNSPQRWTR